MDKFTPLRDRVLLLERAQPEKVGDLYIPNGDPDIPSEGEIVAAGTGHLLRDGAEVPLQVKVGDIVLFPKDAGVTVKVGGKEHVLLREGDLYGKAE